jgi:hypothetical protein
MTTHTQLAAAIAALALTMMTLPACAEDPMLPKFFHGDWCPIAGKDNQLYRRGKCSEGIRIDASGYSTRTGRCRLTKLDEGPEDFELEFVCKDKRDRESQISGVRMRTNEKGQLVTVPAQ